MEHDNLAETADLARSAVPDARGSWLHALSLHIDRWGNRARARYAQETARRPGYGLADTRHGRIRYRMHGTGRALAFAADPPVVLEQYDELVAELAPDHRVIVFEPIGFGFSTLAEHVARFTFEQAVESIGELLTTLDCGPYVLAFPCASAFSALSLAQRSPALASALVLAQAPSWPELLRWKVARDPHGVLSKPVLGQLALRAVKRSRARQWFALATGSRERRDQLIAGVDDAFDHGAAFSLASAFQSFPDTSFRVPPVDTQTLFIWGLRDRSHGATDRASSLLQAPRARILAAPHLGHFPELEDPKWFGRALREFLER